MVCPKPRRNDLLALWEPLLDSGLAFRFSKLAVTLAASWLAPWWLAGWLAGWLGH